MIPSMPEKRLLIILGTGALLHPCQQCASLLSVVEDMVTALEN